jgi:hypothetical protein
LIEHNLIIGNSAEYGGGILCYESSSKIKVNIIWDNKADQAGGGINSNRSLLTIINNTISGNSAHVKGGGMHCNNHAEAKVVNTIFWNNYAENGSEIYLTTKSLAYPSWLFISFSNVKGGKNSIHFEPNSTLNWGPSMMDVDPLFTDPRNGDFHLTADSPCKDAGNKEAEGLPKMDFEGDPRIANAMVDIGADEFLKLPEGSGEKTPDDS